MAKGGAGKGKGGKGKRTQRSQDYLHKYGYPSNRRLRREAAGLAEGSVASIGEVQRPFERQSQSARDFLSAIQSVLMETQGQVGAGYDQATSQQAALDAATQQRLAGLGLGVDSGGVQAVQGARGDSATANLLSNAASAKAYAASQPGIAAGNTGVTLAGIRKQETDALQTRRDQLRQSFFAALQNVQSNALARASFNQSGDQFAQTMRYNQSQAAQSQANTDRSFNEQVREFNLSRQDAKQTAKAAGLSPSEFRQQAGLVSDYALGTPAETTKVPIYKGTGPWKDPNDHSKGREQHIVGYKTVKVAGSGTGDIAQRGVAFDKALSDLTMHGVQHRVAMRMLMSLYNQYAEAPNGTYEFDAYWSMRDYLSGSSGLSPGTGQTSRNRGEHR